MMNKKIFVDIDGVLCNNTYGKYDEAKPINVNIDKVNELYDKGNTIVLWTARGAGTDIDWRDVTEKQMKSWGVKYHSLSFDKPEYDAIIEDKILDIFGLKCNAKVQVEKVWGREYWIVNSKKYCGKILTLRKGYRCSLHAHKIKDETFYILDGEVLMEVGDKTQVMKSGDIVHIVPNVYHRFTGITDSKIVEFSTQHFDNDSYRNTKSGKVTK